jgi:hypothetical protein
MAEDAEQHDTFKPVPRVQVVPQPYEQASFQRDGDEIARYHFGVALRRPFVFPVIGPSGRSLTRMGHPHDPTTHSHHNSVWLSHHDVGGISFWDDHGRGRIIHQQVLNYEDEGDRSHMTTLNHWMDDATHKVLLREYRRTTAELLEHGQWIMTIDVQFEAPEPVTLGKTPFGLLVVRMAKTIGVNDGGGVIRNSEGQVNEKDVLWKRARWCDYAGPIASNATEGILLMDHPANPNHPTYFHVRGDGWMGASLTYDAPRAVNPGEPLRLRYGLWVHAGVPAAEVMEQRWKEFSETTPPHTLVPAKKK